MVLLGPPLAAHEKVTRLLTEAVLIAGITITVPLGDTKRDKSTEQKG